MAAKSESSVDELKEEFASLREDVSKIADTLGKLSGEQVSHGRERARSAAGRARTETRRAVGAVEEEIRQYPLTSLAAAFGVGYLIGRTLRH